MFSSWIFFPVVGNAMWRTRVETVILVFLSRIEEDALAPWLSPSLGILQKKKKSVHVKREIGRRRTMELLYV
jgi:hypothetical protein